MNPEEIARWLYNFCIKLNLDGEARQNLQFAAEVIRAQAREIRQLKEHKP